VVSKPRIFAHLALDAALARAKEEGKFLLVDATASWCRPCQVMERTTWMDPRVEIALAKLALVIQLDVENEGEAAKRLRVKSMPTVIVFKDDEEIDRVTGLRKTDELLSWFDRVTHGETSIDRLRSDIAAAPTDMHLRMELADRLVAGGDFENANIEYVWLWKHMLERAPSMVGVKHSFLVGYLKGFVADYDPARDAFRALRDEARPKSLDVDVETLADWLSLNRVLEEQDSSLAWFDSNRAGLTANPALARILEHDIGALLIERDRWADLGTCIATPMPS
jgi:thiol-disulfide isomerase/thioredoxin